jgi:hypothetical protein
MPHPDSLSKTISHPTPTPASASTPTSRIPLTPLSRTPCPSPFSALIAPTPASISAATPAIVASAPTPTVIAPTAITPHTSFASLLNLLIQLLDLPVQRTLPRLQQIQILQIRARRQLPQTGRAHAVFRKKIVHELVNVGECESVFETTFDFAVVGEQGLKGLVDLDGLPGEADVEGGEAAEVFELA